MTNLLFLSGVVGAGASLIVTLLLNRGSKKHGSSTSGVASSPSHKVEVWE